MKRFLSVLIALCFISISTTAQKVKQEKIKKSKLEKGMYAVFETNRGTILCKLEFEKTPMTVANFVGLAEGDLVAYDTIKITEPFYDGLVFHRVVPNFVIQGGDPTGTGAGSPGYKFYDETREDLTHSGPGILSMANSDPRNSKPNYGNLGNTNGSQFFITHKETPHLDGLHTVFGHVIKGQDVVNAIQQGDTMYRVKIIRKGKEAKKFDATEELANGIKAAKDNAVARFVSEAQLAEDQKDFMVAKRMYELALNIDPENEQVKGKIESINEQIRKEEAERKAYIDMISKMSEDQYKEYMFKEVKKLYPDAQQTASGLVYIIHNKGVGEVGEEGATMSVHYNGTFRTDGKKFDSSYDRGQPMEFRYKVNRMIPGFEEGLKMIAKGGKATLYIPYFLAYGAAGRGQAIPQYADLVFEIEMIDLKPAPEIEEHQHFEGDGHNHDH